MRQAVPPKYMDIYRSLELLMGAKNNYAAYRQRLHTVIDVPCIPYLGKPTPFEGVLGCIIDIAILNHASRNATRHFPDRSYLFGGRERQHAR